MPVVSTVTRRRRVLRPTQSGRVPVEREADERYAEPLEGREALVERPGAELQPRVVLDSVANAVRSLRRARGSAGRNGAQQREHTGPGHRRRTFSRRALLTR